MAKKRNPMDPTKPAKPHGRPKKGRDPGKPPDWYCDGHNREGQPCARRAGHGTDHPGEGKCKSHGGATPPKSHGRYSKITRPRLAELIEQFEADQDPGNLLPELHLLRALVVDYVERYDQFTEALLLWHESWKEGDQRGQGKPRQVIDILSVGKFIGEIGSLVDKIQKQKQEGSISMATFERVTDTMGEEVVKAAQEVISDAATRTSLIENIEARWGSVRLDPVKSRAPGAP